MNGILRNYTAPKEELLADQDLYNELVKIRSAISKKDLSSQFKRYLNELSEHEKIGSKTRILNTIAHSGGKTGQGWLKEDMTEKLEPYGISIKDIEHLVRSLADELKNPYSEFHKLSCNLLQEDGFSDDAWKYIKQSGKKVSVFGCTYTETPLNENIWALQSNKQILISRRYSDCIIGVSPKIHNVMPENFYIRKVATNHREYREPYPLSEFLI